MQSICDAASVSPVAVISRPAESTWGARAGCVIKVHLVTDLSLFFTWNIWMLMAPMLWGRGNN